MSARAWLATLTLLCGCGMITPPPAEPPPAVAVDGRAEALARDVVAAANAARAQAGVARLAPDAQLGTAAADYARELAARGTLSHTSIRRGYTTLMERLALAGARVVRAGENLGAMSARSELPVQVIRMWLDSEGHRRNLLNPAYTLTGAGAAAGADGTWYFVQVYASPADTRR